MIHFSCDACGKEISSNDQRYLVKMETHPAHDPAEITDDDLDDDHLEQVAEALRDLEDCDDIEDPRKSFRFDLCCDCHQKFVSNPLGKEHNSKLLFSKN